MQYLDIDKSQIPLKVFYMLENILCELRFKYNYSHDFFTVDLYRNDEPFITGEKIVYGKPLFTLRETFLKNTTIIPMDLSMNETRITFSNFGETVFLFVFER